VGISGDDYRNPAAFSAGFRAAMLVSAALLAAGGVLAACTIRDDAVKAAPPPGRRTHCAVDGTPVEAGAPSPRV
jgi:hypothetical protein